LKNHIPSVIFSPLSGGNQNPTKLSTFLIAKKIIKYTEKMNLAQFQNLDTNFTESQTQGKIILNK
jgi:hypothetical protein